MVNSTFYGTAAISAAVLWLALAGAASAHCDSMDGPVIADAKRALAGERIDPVLKWIPAEDEDVIRQTFEMALEVREGGDAARTLADRHFFETLVRLHRASEGEGFTGLKPAGEVGPGIAAADEALDSGEIAPLANELAEAVREAIVHRFETAHKVRRSADESPEQGRAYVETYVQFTHFVEQLEHLLHKGASHKHLETVTGGDPH